MARGWESKSIESQQDDAARQTAKGRDLTPNERDQAAKKGGLELAMAQTQAEIGVACRAAHRELLRRRLDAIQAQLATLS